jgi:hypothetical protein
VHADKEPEPLNLGVPVVNFPRANAFLARAQALLWVRDWCGSRFATDVIRGSSFLPLISFAFQRFRLANSLKENIHKSNTHKSI